MEELRTILDDPSLRIIVMQGPPGCGKHCTLRVLCKELGYAFESSLDKEGCVMGRAGPANREATSISELKAEKDLRELNRFMAELSLASRETQYSCFRLCGRPIRSNFLKCASVSAPAGPVQPARKAYVIESIPEWAKSPESEVRLEFRKKLKRTLDEASPNIKYFVMSNNPDEQYPSSDSHPRG